MLKKLKSLFIVEDAAAKAAKNNAESASSETNTNPSNTQPSIKVDTSPTPKGQGKPDEKFVNRLLEAIEEANLDGFDYLEYKQSLQSIDEMNMDEATMFKSSLAMSKTMGATPAKLISSAEHYITVLKNEEKKFQDALNNQHQKVVAGRQMKISKLEETMLSKTKRIEELKAEIAKSKEDLEKAKSSIDAEVAKIQGTKSGFYAAYHIVVDQIQEDLVKMKKYFT